MVDALDEAHRILNPGGTLLDLRPLPSNPQIDIVTPDTSFHVGKVDDTGFRPDTNAANLALEKALDNRRFNIEKETTFGLFYYFDTPDELWKHANENWTDSFIPSATFEFAQQVYRKNPNQSRLRIHYTMSIGRYRKI